MNDFYYSWTRQDSPVDFPVASAEGDEFILSDGRRIYDFISTSFQANFGHRQPLIQQRITDQLHSMPIASPKSTFNLKQSVSTRLNELIGQGSGKIFYTVSGAESVENALKIARQLTGRKVILARQKSYHGATLGALSVTGDWRNAPHLTFDEGTVRIPDHDEDPDLSKTRSIIEETGSGNIAAVILETISGTNGMSVPSKSWFDGIQSLSQEHGFMLILDEVLVGFGRCGPAFAFHDYGLQPDMVTLSKAISGGYVPFGALWTNQKIAQEYDRNVLVCGLTNYGHPLGLAALDAVLDLLEDPAFLRKKQDNEKRFGEFLSKLSHDHSSIVELRQRGLMAAVFLDRPAPSWQLGFDAGLHFFAKGNLNILAPPYNSEANRLNQALETYASLLK